MRLTYILIGEKQSFEIESTSIEVDVPIVTIDQFGTSTVNYKPMKLYTERMIPMGYLNFI